MSEYKNCNNLLDCLKRILIWIFSSNSQGLGTLLLGISGLIALFKADNLLNQILKIQDQAENIKSAVIDLRVQSKEISKAVDLLTLQIIDMKAKTIVEMSATLKSESPSKKQIEEAIKSIPQNPSSTSGSVFIPKSNYETTVNKLLNAKTGREREIILMNAMEYSPKQK